METRRLGKNGIEVPVLCFGGYPLSGDFGEYAEDQAVRTVHAALDVGINFIDTAESYGISESYIGKAIQGRRHEVILATKLSYDHSWERMQKAVDASLKALDTDYVDLYQLHSPRDQWPIQETMGNLMKLRDQGKVRYIGVSNFSADQTQNAMRFGPIHSSQPRYSMLFRDVEESVLPFCLDNQIGVIPYTVLGKGLLTGKYKPGDELSSDDVRGQWKLLQGEQFERIYTVTELLKAWSIDHGRDMVQLAIAWVLANPAITSAIVGAKSPEQVRQIAAAADWKLSSDDLAELDSIQGTLRFHDADAD